MIDYGQKLWGLGLFLHNLRQFFHNMFYGAKIGPFPQIYSKMTKNELVADPEKIFRGFVCHHHSLKISFEPRDHTVMSHD